MTFTGWTGAAIEFYEGLEADNSKSYWQAHKADYETLVLAPMEALLAELAGEFGDARIFRPYRDTRFSADKSPYKTGIGARLATRGYVHFDADGLGVGSGYYMMEADQLDRFRRAIDIDRTGREIARLVDETRAAGLEVRGHESLKSAPRGYTKDHPRIELLRQKGLIVWKHWTPAAWLATAKAKQRVVDVLRAAGPINAWLDEHVGPSA
jgi:uncharacterized protein (TIGR02453 family)